MPYMGGGGRNVNWRLTIPLLVVVVAYVILGAAIFYFLEKPSRQTHENTKRKVVRQFIESYPDVTEDRVLELLNNFSREVYLSSDQLHTYDLSQVTGEDIQNWNFGTAVYFVVTVITTIGYGDVIPVSSEGRIFCCIYALIGIPTCLVLLANVGGALFIVIKRIDNRVDCLRRNPRRAQAVRCAALFAIGLCFFVLLPSYMFSTVEEWGIGNSIYYAFITLSTVGLGDFVAGHRRTPWYPAVLVIWLFLGLAWLSTTINSTQELITELLREESTNSENKDPDEGAGGMAEAEITVMGSGNGIKTISQRSLDSNVTLDTTVMRSPTPPSLSRERNEFAMSKRSHSNTDSLNYVTDDDLPTYQYQAKTLQLFTSTPSTDNYEKPQELAREDESILSEATCESDDQQILSISPTSGVSDNKRDKGVQVSLIPLSKGLYSSATHTPPTGVARIYPIGEIKRQERPVEDSPQATE